ncbi:unnamed protein product, partial [Darwinula stevensoni]
ICELYVAEYEFSVLDDVFVIHDGFREDRYMQSRETRLDLKANAMRSRAFRAQVSSKYNQTSRKCESWFLHSLEFVHVICEVYVSGFRLEVLDSAYVIHDGWKWDWAIPSRGKRQDLHDNVARFVRFREDLAAKYPGAGRSCTAAILSRAVEIVQYVVGHARLGAMRGTRSPVRGEGEVQSDLEMKRRRGTLVRCVAKCVVAAFVALLAFVVVVDFVAIPIALSRRQQRPVGTPDADLLRELIRSRPDLVLDESGEFGISYRHVEGRRGGERNYSDVTWVTLFSLEHLHQVAQIAQLWQGPMSVSVLAETTEEIEATARAIDCLVETEPAVADHVTFHLVFGLRRGSRGRRFREAAGCAEVLASLRAAEAGVRNFASREFEFPPNLLRNVARRSAGTEFVFVVDGDFIPSPGLRADFLGFASREGLFGRDESVVYIVPAFEAPEGFRLPENKRELIGEWEDGEVRPFYSGIFSFIQGGTDYPRWKALQPGTGLHVAYDVPWQYLYEPFVIARNTVPYYEERFRQFGWDRVSQICEMHVAGYQFRVLDNAFVLHRGLKEDTAIASKEKREDLKRNVINFIAFREELMARYPGSPRSCSTLLFSRFNELAQLISGSV